MTNDFAIIIIINIIFENDGAVSIFNDSNNNGVCNDDIHCIGVMERTEIRSIMKIYQSVASKLIWIEPQYH